jgi:hypothetical protein
MEILRKIGRENRKTNELEFQEMAAILSPHGLYGGNRKSKIPLLNNQGYKPLKGGFGSLQIFSIGRMPGDRTSRSLDASLAILTRVLCFEASGALRPQTGQTSSPNRPGWFWPDTSRDVVINDVAVGV